MAWTIESALRTTFIVIRNSFGPFYAAALVFTAPVLLVDLIDGGFAVSLIVSLLSNVLVSLSLAVGTLRAMAGMPPPDSAALLRQANRPQVGAVILLGIVQSVVIGLGFVLIVPGLWVLALWMVAMPAILVEHCDIGMALNRSTDLTRNRRGRVLATFIIGALIAGVPLGLLDLLVSRLLDFDEGSAGNDIVSWLTGAALATVLASLPAVLYVLLRGEAEGKTPDEIAAELDQDANLPTSR